MAQKPVIAIAGLSCETSTFTPARTEASAFHVWRGDEIFDRYPFLRTGNRLGDAAEWHCALVGYALPGGVLTPAAFEGLLGEIISRLGDIIRQTSLDGFWLDIHGAMVVKGVEDCEFEILRRIRKVIGPAVVVSASMDLHGNVSEYLAHQTDLITCYRTAPHVDVLETKERACRNLIELLDRRGTAIERGGRPALPFKARIPIPVLSPGEQTSTRLEPAKSLYEAVPEVEAVEGIIDAAIWVGYAWADERRSHAVVVVTGWDQSVVNQGAEGLARLFWEHREDFRFVAPTGSFDDCLDSALRSHARPYFISDSGDNPTAGGSGDVTWTVRKLLARPEVHHASAPRIIYASLPGPEAVAIAVKAGIGATVTVTAGAQVDDIHGAPITMTGCVYSIKHGDRHAITEAVLQVGSVLVILTKSRKPYHLEHDFTSLGIDVRRDMDIVIVKIGYLEPELFDMAKDWMLALTPGGVDQDLERLGHAKIVRPMWPFDKVFRAEPDLRAQIVPPSTEALVDCKQ